MDLCCNMKAFMFFLSFFGELDAFNMFVRALTTCVLDLGVTFGVFVENGSLLEDSP